MSGASSSTARLRFVVVLFLILLACVLLAPSVADAQTLTVLYTFTGEHSQDGASPMSGVVMDRAGNLYGTTFSGGLNGDPGQACFTFEDDGGCGTVFKLTKHGSSWIYSQLYKFQAAPDGNFPNGAVIGPDGALYGTTYGGGFGQEDCDNFWHGCGIAFRLQPQPNICPSISCPWIETVLHTFHVENGDGATPASADLIFDHAGNIYGTTEMGGPTNSGTVYQLVPSQSGWTLNALQVFQCVGGLNGCYPETPIFDAQGNLVVTMSGAGFYGEGTAIKLVASDNWSIDLLYTFQHGQGGPSGPLTIDAAGKLYGVASTCALPAGNGCIYKLTPSSGGYTFTDLYDFTNGPDGRNPSGRVTIDANGNLYGTAQAAGDLSRCLGEGQNGCGTVWELTP